MTDLDDRITAALTAAAGAVHDRGLRPLPPAAPRRPWLAPLLSAAAVVGLTVSAAAVIGVSHHDDGLPAGDPGPTAPSSSTPAPHPTGERACAYWAELSCGQDQPGYHPFAPLWPYATLADRPTAPTAGQLDAGQVALAFVRDYLGLTDLNRAYGSVTTDADDVYVAVGSSDNPTAAYLHLVRYETTYGDESAPWEVVGTDDGFSPGGPQLNLDRPQYGTQLDGAQLTVGEDHSAVAGPITVTARSAATGQLLDSAVAPDPDAADGWSVDLDLAGADAGGAVAVVAAQGGTATAPDRFEVTAVYAAK